MINLGAGEVENLKDIYRIDKQYKQFVIVSTYTYKQLTKEDLQLAESKGLFYPPDPSNYKVSTIEKKFGQKNHNNFVQYCYDFQNNNLEYCKKFIYNIDTIFRNEDIVENFRELNIKYKVFDKDLKVLLNETN